MFFALGVALIHNQETSGGNRRDPLHGRNIRILGTSIEDRFAETRVKTYVLTTLV